ncbi:zf-HC2 domain-containing protein [Paenibacillus sp. LHD-117]|uniref:anti-sigma factor family protein n=1 Tax=Paenibacillus sp. LHD-117 TaxID=3071412 RepID=UPI0027E1090C|nr:zf-HC2 domain-containing protein [Paenibacillus sp. LHD-117]MDQ6423327.1 zf-HC2 domain-containing protein [Paenibacillus sp. LHD-117]
MTELMQRQLDDDLRESEMEVLMNHTRHCPDCAAMFERLTRLSAELTSLPKVTPSYSLVDAIMPELIRIDLEAKEAASSAVPSIGGTTVLPKRRTQRTRRWPSWKSISGVVAAGIVAGIFLITYPPQSGKSDNDAANSLGYSAEMKLPETAADDSQLSQMSSMADPGGDASGAAANESPVEIETGAKDIADAMKNDDGDTGTDIRTKGATEEAGIAERNEVIDQSGGSTNGLAGKAPEMGITSQSMIPSPDGQYVANVDQYTVQILSAADGSLLMETDRKNGTHGKLSWSEDSTELRYEVSLEHGAAEQYVIDVAAKKERKAD